MPREDISLNSNTKYVKVVNLRGERVWKKVSELLPEDEYILKEDGSPYQMTHMPGRKKTSKKKEKLPDLSFKEVISGKKKDESKSLRKKRLEELYQKRKEHLDRSSLVSVVKHSPESLDVLQNIMVGIASEVESMTFDRDLASRNGQETSMISTRIVQGYKAIGDAFLKRQDQIMESELDLSSLVFRNLLKYIMETVKEAMLAVEIPPGEVEAALMKVSEKMNQETWVLEARKRMAGK